MEPNKMLDTAKAGAEFGTKLTELAEKILGPRIKRKQTKADLEADEQRLKMIRDNPDMEIVYTQGQMSARARNPEALYARAEQRMHIEAVRQQENIEKVIELASGMQKEDEIVSDEPVDEDWITRFFSIVKDVSVEDMQILWARILAGEVKQPGHFSIRTLETLKNLNRNEAEMFSQLAPFVIFSSSENCFIPSDIQLLNKFSISYNTIYKLSDCGLIDSSGFLNNSFTVSFGHDDSYYNNHVIVIIKNIDVSCNIQMEVGEYPLTQAGAALIGIVTYETNDDFFSEFCKSIKEKYNKDQLQYTQHRIINICGNTINYETYPLRVV